MDYVAVCISILLWLVRPQDWMSGFAGVNFMTYAMIVGMIGLYRRPGGVAIRHFTQSPADLLVISYLAWTVWTTGSWFELTKAMLPFAAFYFVTALALNTPRRLHTFLNCWVAGLSIVMVFALSTVYGFEFVPGSLDLTEQFNERLALNTWIYNNPNALGHGVVALIPAAYIWLIWRRSGGIRVLGLAIIAGAAQVTVLTGSKGAYLCGAFAVTIMLMFRKSRIVQIFMLVCMLTAGVGALKMLPRMETLDSKEAGIAGRLLIWQMAHNAMVNTRTGEGWKVFEAWIDTEDWGLIRKATHGSYVNVGADLGYMGLMLFVGILYANSRTLLQARVDPEDVELERCQRLLLSLTASFVASAWIIDRAYHTDYFILAGVVAAFHRLMTAPKISPEDEEAQDEQVPTLAALAQLPALARVMPQLAGMGQAATLPMSSALLPENAALARGIATRADAVKAENEEDDERPRIGLNWRRLQGLDIVCMIALLFAVDRIWQYLMTSFISF